MKNLRIRIFFISMVLQIACSQNSTKYVRTILIAKSVNNSFVHSEENSDLNIKGQKYWVHYKADYDVGELISFARYYPEGPINYTIEELKSDTAIYKSLNIPLMQNWIINEESLTLIEEGKYIKITKLDDFHFKENKGYRIFVTK